MNETITQKNKITEIINSIKSWAEDTKHKKWINVALFSVIVFFWTYIISGTLIISLIHLVSGATSIYFKETLTGKRKPLSTLAVFLVMAASFVATQSLSTSLMALFTVGICSVAYISFRTATRKTEWVVGAFLPLAVIMYTEFLQHTSDSATMILLKATGIARFGFVLSIILVAVVSAFFICLFNNKRIGYYISVGIFALLGNVNFFVHTLTEQPFTISDLNIATTAAGVLNNQKLALKDWLWFVLGLVLLAAIYAIITIVYKKKEKKKKFIYRTVPLAGLCGVLLVAYIASGWLYNLVLLYNGHLKYGFIGNFYITLNEKINIPEDANLYVIEDENDEGDNKPNVIIVMNEAFSDLGTTFDIPLSEDPLEYFHSLQKEFPHGITYSSVRGNNTCSSEWELLSGSPTALTTKGAMIYQNNCKPMRSLVSLFNSRGYTTMGLHPYYSFGYNRDSFYDALGFNETVFLENLPNETEKVRGYVTDEANYLKLIEMYERNESKGDAPFFCFNITMQNHGSYETNLMSDVKLIGDNEYVDVNTYLSVLDRSDDALKTLISYFETVEEDTIILMFGDHQPMLDKRLYEDIYGKPYAELMLEELTDIYAVPYLIWANYDLNEAAAPAETSNCYLSTILFDVGNIPKSTWLHMVDEYREEYPVISAIFVKEKDGDIKTKDLILKSESDSASHLLKEYQKYSYGILYGLGDSK